MDKQADKPVGEVHCNY